MNCKKDSVIPALQTELEAAQTRLMSLKAGKMKGELLGAEEVCRLLEERIGNFKHLILALPAEFYMHTPSLTPESIAFIEDKFICTLKILSQRQPA